MCCIGNEACAEEIFGRFSVFSLSEALMATLEHSYLKEQFDDFIKLQVSLIQSIVQREVVVFWFFLAYSLKINGPPLPDVYS